MHQFQKSITRGFRHPLSLLGCAPLKWVFSVKFKYFGALAFAGTAVVTAAASAETKFGSTSITVSCELHIWPAEKNLAVIYYNPIYSGRDRAFVGIRGNPPVPKTLTPEEQVALLQQISLPRLFNLPPATTIVPHEQQLEREDAMAAKRHSNSTSLCQAELLVHSVVYESADQVSRSLRVTMTYQYFSGGQASPARRFSTSAKARLKQYPATKIGEVPAANAELDNAFQKAVMTFAGYANGASDVTGSN
jgi:hypothetical protein